MKSHASMNRIDRPLWNAALNLRVAVAKNAKGARKSAVTACAQPTVLAIPSLSARAADAAPAHIKESYFEISV